MRSRIITTVISIFVIFPFAANAVPIVYEFEGSNPDAWTIDAAFFFESDDLAAGDIIGDLRDWTVSWTNGASTFGLSNANSSVAGSSFMLVDAALNVLAFTFCTNGCDPTEAPAVGISGITWSATIGSSLVVDGRGSLSGPSRITQVPEPGTLALFGIGLLGLIFTRRKTA